MELELDPHSGDSIGDRKLDFEALLIVAVLNFYFFIQKINCTESNKTRT